MNTSNRFRWLTVSVVTVVLASMLIFLYVRTRGYDLSGYFENIALSRQLQQLDERSELNVLKSKIGINTNYDPLVETSFDLNQLRKQLQKALTIQQHALAGALSTSSAGLRDAIQDKTRFIEMFKSHNAVLRNSLTFLPTAANDTQRAVNSVAGKDKEAADPGALRRVRELVKDVLLATIIFSEAQTSDAAANIRAGLDGLAAAQESVPATLRESLKVFSSHVRTVLREQPLVDNLLSKIAATPVRARLHDIENLLNTEQQAAELERQRYRQYLLIFATALVTLLLHAAVRLIRSHAVINRVNSELQDANTTLERRVQERTHELHEAQSRLFKDITELREAERRRDELERQLLHSQKLEALGTLAGGIAHDLNNALVPVLALSQLLMDSVAENDREDLQTIILATRRAKELVQQILAFSRKQEIQKAEVDAAGVVMQALQMLRLTLPPNIAVIEEIDPVPPILADAGQLQQVVVNLVTNAAQAIGRASASITVAVSALGPTGDTERGENFIQIRIADTGCGIDKEVLDRIFEPFFTTKGVGEGTGLGLSVVHGIVTGHGGTIEVASEPGKGTTFTILLPGCRPAVAPLEAVAAD